MRVVQTAAAAAGDVAGGLGIATAGEKRFGRYAH